MTNADRDELWATKEWQLRLERSSEQQNFSPLSFYAMSRTPPHYPRAVYRPGRAYPYVVYDAYGGRIGEYATIEQATAALSHLSYRGTTFGQWWEERRRQRG